MDNFFILKTQENDTAKEVPCLWGTYAMKLFTSKRGMPLPQLFDFIQKGEYSLDDLVDMIWAAAQYGCRKKGLSTEFDDLVVAEWIDAAGGIGGDQVVGFMAHIIESIVVNTSDKVTEEKKSTALTGTTQ